ncbi:hypothetical protein PL11_005095 [Lentilactobacillus curieae]|uniref:Uncharacterized protein n=1 Tax=Lentilactobacillus curieae TaxID=1138822 RepID=A0A1S6QIB8_9LACO|nr:hypothetical protein [Lentilactobacillus curieae]AQW21348.1 hypothetical protein PL11_005095 [Lentilactobacillus curieae]
MRQLITKNKMKEYLHELTKNKYWYLMLSLSIILIFAESLGFASSLLSHESLDSSTGVDTYGLKDLLVLFKGYLHIVLNALILTIIPTKFFSSVWLSISTTVPFSIAIFTLAIDFLGILSQPLLAVLSIVTSFGAIIWCLLNLKIVFDINENYHENLQYRYQSLFIINWIRAVGTALKPVWIIYIVAFILTLVPLSLK